MDKDAGCGVNTEGPACDLNAACQWFDPLDGCPHGSQCLRSSQGNIWILRDRNKETQNSDAFLS